jgi:pyruvate carboxylase
MLCDQVTSLPIHFHTHDTSGGSIATTLAMAAAGCNIIDFATASMANCTSQPSLNAFLAAMAGDPRDPGIDYLTAEPYDIYWAKVRSGLACGPGRDKANWAVAVACSLWAASSVRKRSCQVSIQS